MAKRGRKTIEEIHPAAFRALANIRLLKAAYGTTDETIARAAGMTVRTLVNRKNAPWTFTIGELRDIANVWELTVNDLMSELRICV